MDIDVTGHYTNFKISVAMHVFHQHTKILVFPTVIILLHSLSLDHIKNDLEIICEFSNPIV